MVARLIWPVVAEEAGVVLTMEEWVQENDLGGEDHGVWRGRPPCYSYFLGRYVTVN